MPERTVLIDIHEQAARLGVSPRTVRRLVAAGRIPVVRVGGQLRFDPVRVLAALEYGGKR